MTTNQHELDFLRHHDWADIACQCDQHPEPCPHRATHIVAIHALERCNEPDYAPFGDRVEIRCLPCLVNLHADVTEQLLRMDESGERFECSGCGAPVHSITDVIRSVQDLR